MTSHKNMNDILINPAAPIYLQVHDEIKKDILEQRLKHGDRLPSEEELAKQFRISRMTLRKSLGLLINEGYIYSQHGIGTFISKPPIQVNYLKMISFSAWVKSQGHIPDAEILSISEIPFTKEIHEGLNLKKRQSVICIKRLRKVDGLPVAIEHSYHPKENYDNYHITNPDTDLKSIFSIMEKNGFHAIREVDTISAENASSDQADLLDILTGDALLTFTTITYSKQGFPLEYLTMVARPDRAQFTFVLPR
jgi:GntR family transcriptional regulator